MNDDTICRRTREGLTEYLEGALSPRRRQGMAGHLADCSECRGLLEQVRGIIAAARAVPAERMPAGLRRHLLRRLSESGEREAVESGGISGEREALP